MKKRMFAILALSAVMLCACGKEGSQGDIDTTVSIGGEDPSGAAEAVAGKEETGEPESVQEDSIVTEVQAGVKEEVSEEKLEAYGEAVFQEDGTVGVIFEANVLSREEEVLDTSIHKVKLADVEGYKAERKGTGQAEEKTDEEWLAIMLKGCMRQKEIPEGMPLKEMDRVTVRVVSTGGVSGYEDIEGKEKEAMLGNCDMGANADAALLGASVGDTVTFMEKVPDTGEETEIKLEVLSAYGDREMEDLCDAWVKVNYPEYEGKDAFLEWMLGRRVRGVQVLDADAELSRFLDYLVKNSTAEGVEEGSHQAYMLVEAAYLSTHGLSATAEAYQECLAGDHKTEEEYSKKTFVEDLLKQAMYEDLGGDEHWVEN